MFPRSNFQGFYSSGDLIRAEHIIPRIIERIERAITAHPHATEMGRLLCPLCNCKNGSYKAVQEGVDSVFQPRTIQYDIPERPTSVVAPTLQRIPTAVHAHSWMHPSRVNQPQRPPTVVPRNVASSSSLTQCPTVTSSTLPPAPLPHHRRYVALCLRRLRAHPDWRHAVLPPWRLSVLLRFKQDSNRVPLLLHSQCLLRSHEHRPSSTSSNARPRPQTMCHRRPWRRRTFLLIHPTIQAEHPLK